MSMSWHAFKLAAVSLAVAFGGLPAVQACGYHDPSSINFGMLNWSYPDALHVRTAVWMAQRDGLIARDVELDPDDPLPPRMRATLRLRDTVAALTALRERIAGALDGAPVPAFSMVLLRPMLWARFDTAEATLRMEAHADGPGRDDVVIVTDEPVISAWLEGRITPREALASGLVRLYGPPEKVEQVASLLDPRAGAKTTSAAASAREPQGTHP